MKNARERKRGHVTKQVSGKMARVGLCQLLPLPWRRTVRPPLRPALEEGGPGENLLPTGVPASQAPAATPGGPVRSLDEVL